METEEKYIELRVAYPGSRVSAIGLGCWTGNFKKVVNLTMYIVIPIAYRSTGERQTDEVVSAANDSCTCHGSPVFGERSVCVPGLSRICTLRGLRKCELDTGRSCRRPIDRSVPV